jgi:phosphate transport system ATP-binding protein
VTGQAKIEIKKLSIYFHRDPALQQVDLEIPANTVFSLIGPAMGGRTTLLRSLNRMTDLIPKMRREGEILLDGKNIYAPDVSVPALRRRVGMVFELPTPLPMSIFDNIAYGPRLTGIKGSGALNQIVEEALTLAVLWDEVKDRLNTPAGRLSGGQQQRLCMARVLALKPEVILLDQPCSGLDPVSTSKIEESLVRLKERFTIVIAPHNVQQAGRISDRVAFMLSGRVVEEGYVSDIFTAPKDQRTADYVTGRFG